MTRAGPAPPPRGVHLAPTATRIPDAAAGEVVVCGSHGGAYAGYLVALAGARAVILNDAGVGLDRAGIGALPLLEAIGMAAATVAHTSARIGDAAHALGHGVVSHANAPARAAGCHPGMTCLAAARALASAPAPRARPTPYAEARETVGTNPQGLAVVCLDSISLVTPADAGQVVLSGSHGGVVAGQRALAIKAPAAGAFFNDAGIGCDQAGIARLAVLDEMGVAGATVSAASARIGDGRSTYRDGVLSAVNGTAAAMGLAPGHTALAAAAMVPVHGRDAGR